ncbi:MAG: putative selenium-dependent hydroxylase accessory protein YqeC [Dehalococcoidaceae bacterium]|nr:putative selenium-dependent hydroxylase accessory protein YqeC [Dehalococcoidaceae bacterium]
MAGHKTVNTLRNVNLTTALGLATREIISLVGGGGKSTLMQKLAGELEHARQPVITTTTTHILLSQATGYLILEDKPETLLARAGQALANHPHLTLACSQKDSGKLSGPDTATINKLAGFADYIIIEADGANQKPVKIPSATEPVIAGSTTLVVAMVGIDCLGQPANRSLFRHEIAADVIGIAPDDTITPQVVADLLLHPRGIAKGSPAGARIIAFINKIESDEDLSGALDIARRLSGHSIFSRVIMGTLRNANPVIGVIQL